MTLAVKLNYRGPVFKFVSCFSQENRIFKMIWNPVLEIGQILIVIVDHSIMKAEWPRG